MKKIKILITAMVVTVVTIALVSSTSLAEKQDVIKSAKGKAALFVTEDVNTYEVKEKKLGEKKFLDFEKKGNRVRVEIPTNEVVSAYYINSAQKAYDKSNAKTLEESFAVAENYIMHKLPLDGFKNTKKEILQKGRNLDIYLFEWQKSKNDIFTGDSIEVQVTASGEILSYIRTLGNEELTSIASIISDQQAIDKAITHAELPKNHPVKNIKKVVRNEKQLWEIQFADYELPDNPHLINEYIVWVDALTGEIYSWGVAGKAK